MSLVIDGAFVLNLRLRASGTVSLQTGTSRERWGRPGATGAQVLLCASRTLTWVDSLGGFRDDVVPAGSIARN
ncbi:MAG: hypothetical protein QOC98_3358 [Frankiaceae bacterium]|nr:hypothetical protein [Frankiaceae bacterium]